jgi:Tfp pilus assembly protein PilF
MTHINIEQSISVALQHHRMNQFAQAEAIYRQVLDQQPNHSDALHLLGVLAGQTGQLDAAVALIRRAIEICATNGI